MWGDLDPILIDRGKKPRPRREVGVESGGGPEWNFKESISPVHGRRGWSRAFRRWVGFLMICPWCVPRPPISKAISVSGVAAPIAV